MTWRLAVLLNRIRKETNTMTTPAPLKGCDYSTARPKISALAPAGIKFVVRYTSPGVNPKNLTQAELTALLAAGIEVAVVFESVSGRMLAGHGAGISDAITADTAVKMLGMPGLPVYFACDFDAAAGQQPLINDYLDGAASVIGRARTGIYGGYWPVSRALNAAKATYAWQTYAWSSYTGTLPPHAEKWEVPPHSGHWFLADTRAQLRQGPNGVPLGGGTVDLDHAYATDFGQWPRPKPPPQAGPFRHVVPAGNTQTWHQLAQARGTTDEALAAVTRANLNAENLAFFDAFMAWNDALHARGLPLAVIPETLVWWSVNE